MLKKLAPYLIHYQLPTTHELDIRDSKSATWKDVVYAAMSKLKTSNLESIYKEIDGHEKTKTNPNWKACVRRTLQETPKCFRHVERGVWQLAA